MKRGEKAKRLSPLPGILAGDKEFGRTWDEFLHYRAYEQKEKDWMNERAQKGMLKKLAGFRPIRLAAALLRDSMDHDWKGVGFGSQVEQVQEGLKMGVSPAPTKDPEAEERFDVDGRLDRLASLIPQPFREQALALKGMTFGAVQVELKKIERRLMNQMRKNLGGDVRGDYEKKIDGIMTRIRPPQDVAYRVHQNLWRVNLRDYYDLPQVSLVPIMEARRGL